MSDHIHVWKTVTPTPFPIDCYLKCSCGATSRDRKIFKPKVESKFPHAISPEIVGACADGESIVLTVIEGEKETNHHDPFTGAKWDPPLKSTVHYHFRVSDGAATQLVAELALAIDTIRGFHD